MISIMRLRPSPAPWQGDRDHRPQRGGWSICGSIRGSVEACSKGSCFGLHFWSQTATKHPGVRLIDNQLQSIIISGTAIPPEGYSKKAGELPDTSDQGHGVEEVEHLAVSDNGVISNLDPSERHDRQIFGPDHEITSCCR